MTARATNNLPNIYDYLDYRQFLKDLTTALKKAKKFNLRSFAKRANIQAAGYLKMVTDGRRNLSDDTARKFCRALQIEAKEKSYFLTLVIYNQSNHPDEKKQAFDKLIALKPRSEHFLVEKKQNRYFSRHHYVCIREMVTLKDFCEDHKWIAKRCFPRISPSQAKEAIETLLELGLLKRDESGKLIQIENFIRTEDRNTQEAETYHFHEAVIDNARFALGEIPQSERNYYAMTLPISKDLFHEIIDDFYVFRDKIIAKVNAQNNNFDEVYQINFQLFPATRKDISNV